MCDVQQIKLGYYEVVDCMNELVVIVLYDAKLLTISNKRKYVLAGIEILQRFLLF